MPPGRKRLKADTETAEQKAKRLEAFLFGSDQPQLHYLPNSSQATEAFEDRGHPAAAEQDEINTSTPEQPPVELPASDSEDDTAQPEQDSRVKSILDMLDEASDQDEPETYQQEPERDSAPEPVASPQPSAQTQRRPVWEDPDDAAAVVDISGRSRLRKLRQHDDEQTVTGQEYEQRLRQQHKKLHPRTAWARRRPADPQLGEGGAAEPSAVDSFLAGAEALTQPSRGLPQRTLEVTRVADANRSQPSGSALTSVQFHPSGQLLLTAGLDRRLHFFQVDGLHNEKLQTVFLDDMPIKQASFACSGDKVVATGERRHLYIFDLAAAKAERVVRPVLSKGGRHAVASGEAAQPLVALLGADAVSLLSLKSRQAVGSLRGSRGASCAAFSADGLMLHTAGTGGTIHSWDLRMQRCLHRTQDEGALRSTALACAPDSRLLAAGSDSGVVNLYPSAASSGLKSAPGSAAAAVQPVQHTAPRHSFLNLTTSTSGLCFSPDGRMLAMASKDAKNALRVAHVESCTVFENWPTQATPLHFVTCLAFSPNCGYLAAGNARGRALLYRLNHYTQA